MYHLTIVNCDSRKVCFFNFAANFHLDGLGVHFTVDASDNPTQRSPRNLQVFFLSEQMAFFLMKCACSGRVEAHLCNNHCEIVKKRSPVPSMWRLLTSWAKVEN